MNKHPDLLFAENFYKEINLSVENFKTEVESADYSAATFNLNNNKILFRTSKITPTKTGQFVTLWKRINNGTIQPFDALDPIDFVIISIRSGNQLGQFVFPKRILCDKNIFSKNNRGGKRAIRVYAPWDDANSKQALSTQQWQSEFFVGLNDATHSCSASYLFRIRELEASERIYYEK